MIKKNIKLEKGITLIALVITIIIMLILLGITATNINNSNNSVQYNSMVADIDLLQEKILIYYNKYKEIPVKSISREIDGVTYKEIDLSKLENVTLNYGIKYDNDEEDIYLINDDLEIYYLKGVKKSGIIYHRKEQ